MTWVSAAILSSATMGVVSIIDSHLISKRMPSLGSYLIPAGAVTLVYGLIVFKLFPLPANVGTLPILLALASGIVRTIGITIVLYTLQKEEVSRVIPVLHTYPIFVAILAALTLGEALNWTQWLAIVITVAGAVLVSLNRTANTSKLKVGKSLGFLFGASALLGIANTISKYTLDYISPWSLYSLTTFCMVGVFFVLFLRPKVFHELRDMKNPRSAMSLIVGNETLVLLSMILFFWAVEKGPVSLVSTINTARPVFVFFYAVALSRLSPVLLEWHLSKQTIALRGISIAMIVAGITLVSLY
jgi:drug/metabolite transporter (DMT)-like permease